MGASSICVVGAGQVLAESPFGDHMIRTRGRSQVLQQEPRDGYPQPDESWTDRPCVEQDDTDEDDHRSEHQISCGTELW